MRRRAALLFPLLALACRSAPATDPLAHEMRRWSGLARTDPSTDEISVEVRKGALPVLAEAEAALAAGRRLLALERLAAARSDLDAARYLRERAAAAAVDAASFEAEWKRMGDALAPHLAKPSPAAFDGVQPAAIRALGEAALSQVRLYYEASLEYGQNTMPESGLLYLGAARAQRDLALWCRQLSARPPGQAPPLRAIGPELDALESDLLAAYRPPASIDRHPEFIAASAAVKEARELDAAGLRHGALLLYLQAVRRTAQLRAAAAAPEPDVGAVAADLRVLEDRLGGSGGIDHSIARLFLETARADLEARRPSPRAAAAVASDVVPRYLAALGPAPRVPAPPEPRVTVTMVRWPFT